MRCKKTSGKDLANVSDLAFRALTIKHKAYSSRQPNYSLLREVSFANVLDSGMLIMALEGEILITNPASNMHIADPKAPAPNLRAKMLIVNPKGGSFGPVHPSPSRGVDLGVDVEIVHPEAAISFEDDGGSTLRMGAETPQINE